MRSQIKVRANAIEADIYIPKDSILAFKYDGNQVVITIPIEDTSKLAEELEF